MTKATLENGPAATKVDLKISDWKEFTEFLGGSVTPENLDGTLVQAFDEGDIGCQVVAIRDIEVDGTDVSFILEADITDASRFEQDLCQAYGDLWNETEWAPKDAGDAVFEAFLATNGTPSPDELGFEFTNWSSVEVEQAPGPRL